MKVVVTFIILFIAINSCLDVSSLCGNDLIKKVSNDIDKNAFVFYRDCGATTANSIQVSIMNSNEKFNDAVIGNVFTVDAVNSKSYLDSTSVEVEWLSKDSLEIIFDKKLTTYNKESKVLNVNIKYVER